MISIRPWQVSYTGSEGCGVRILRFENLSREWAKFTRDTLGREIPLPVTNESGATRHYSEEYKDDPALVGLVARVYDEDIQRFGYTFEGPQKSNFKNLLGGFMKRPKKAETQPCTSGAAEDKVAPHPSSLPSKSSSSSAPATTTSVSEFPSEAEMPLVERSSLSELENEERAKPKRAKIEGNSGVH